MNIGIGCAAGPCDGPGGDLGGTTRCLDFGLDEWALGLFSPEVLVVATENGAAQGDHRVGALTVQ